MKPYLLLIHQHLRAPYLLRNMNGTTHIEEMLQMHIERHNEDYKKLLWWVIGTMGALVASTATWFINYGTLQEKVNTLERKQQDSVTQQQLNGLRELLDERFKNIDYKLDKILSQ